MTDDHITSLPGRVQAELTRLRAEREVFTAEQDRLKVKLAETEHELEQQLSVATPDPAAEKERRIAELTKELEAVRRENKVNAARAEALASDVAVIRHERASLRAELASTREERDALRLALLDAELVLSAGGVDAAGQFVEASGEPSAERQRLFNAERRAAEMARELDATHRTVSWRVTAPLRIVRRKMDRP